MGNKLKKIKNNITKQVILEETGTKPKQRCPKCNRFTVFTPTKSGKLVCILCNSSIGFVKGGNQDE